MAFINCRHCGTQTSDKRSKCPKCGEKLEYSAPKKPLSFSQKCLAISIVLFSFLFLLDANKSPEQKRADRIERQFHSIDGSHVGLERAIKASMGDPDSYEHIVTRSWDMGDHLVVYTAYRARNAFGGMVKSSIKVKAGLDGTILYVIESFSNL